MAAPESASGTSFEKALGELEALVARMESGDLPLEELLTGYEHGTRLLRVCQQRLQETELRIEQLRRDKAGPVQVPFETARE